LAWGVEEGLGGWGTEGFGGLVAVLLVFVEEEVGMKGSKVRRIIWK
jgi:hypothetical protein